MSVTNTMTPIQLYNHNSIHPLSSVPSPLPTAAATAAPNEKPVTVVVKNAELTVSARLLMNHTLHQDFTSKYVLGQELGSGGFGFVVAATERCTGIERAVKFIIKRKVPSNAWISTQEGPVPIEIYTLKHVMHKNIIQYIDSYQDDVYFYLVMELHGTQWVPPPAPLLGDGTTTTTIIHSPELSENSSTTSTIDDNEEEEQEEEEMMIHNNNTRQFVRRTSCDLFECIEQHKNFEEPLAKMIFKQIVDCVAYLDTVGVCHRDIKDENIVIDQDFKVKLIDFGSSVILPPRNINHQGKKKLFTRFYGTLSFASPEILLSQPYRAEPAEIWSLGILLYTLLCGEIPYENSKAVIEGRMLKPKKHISNQCRHLISCLLEHDPNHRPTIHQVLTHPWLL